VGGGGNAPREKKDAILFSKEKTNTRSPRECQRKGEGKKGYDWAVRGGKEREGVAKTGKGGERKTLLLQWKGRQVPDAVNNTKGTRRTQRADEEEKRSQRKKEETRSYLM